ncbi:hypothetical protein DFH09DRAFT_914255 [Mycena vulgaris]|nr:hypothetical protein DFH09DRAFT_914255 [Mycena vulgaris]
MTKTLYVFEHSVWAAVAELAVAELGYKEGEVSKVVNLVQGENFAPSFLKLNPNATLPTLESDDGKVYTSTREVVACLIKDAPHKVATGTAIIEAIHDPKYDHNFVIFLARNDAELAAKSAGFPKVFLATGQPGLEKYAQVPEAAPYKAFYDARIASNTGMLSLFTGTALPEEKAAFFAQSAAHFAAVKNAMLEVFPAFLPANGFIGGERPGEDDFHVGGWFTRIAASCGARNVEDALAAFERAFGVPVPERLAAYWGAWTARESWKKVYAIGLHQF